jgi:glutamate synthase domain-containing protein 2
MNEYKNKCFRSILHLLATQKPELRKLLNVDKLANQLFNFFSASTELMKVMERAYGHDHLNQFNQNDITLGKRIWQN